MSEDAATGSSRKEKRAKRDAERAAKFRGGAKKSKAEPKDIPEDDAAGQADGVDDQDATQHNAEIGVSEKKSSKKRKRAEPVEETEARDETAAKDSTTTDASEKKRRKTADPNGNETAGKKRFIVFCGNLPYSTTDQSLERHFEKLKPFSLRHRTDPATRKSKGFAFIEFENYDRLKTCLKLYHHSYFDPDDPNAKDPDEDPTMNSRMKKKAKGRKINVMLSAGGGGNTEARKEKIKVKNERLDGQRQRRQEAERKEKDRKKKTQGGDVKDEKAKRAADESAADSGMGGMHPSRLARIQ